MRSYHNDVPRASFFCVLPFVYDVVVVCGCVGGGCVGVGVGGWVGGCGWVRGGGGREKVY
jgi:hypothetical protein